MESVLRDLIRFNKRYKLNFTEVFIKPRVGGKKVERLFFQFMNGNVGSDIRGNDGRVTKSYMMLRKGLVDKLLRYVLVHDPVKLFKPDYHREFFSVLRGALIARILLSLGFYHVGLFLAKKNVSRAEELEVWDVVITLSTILSNYYAIRGDRKSYALYVKTAEQALVNISSDFKVRAYLNKWSLFLSKKRKADQSVLKDLAKDVVLSQEMAEKSTSRNALHYYYRLRIIQLDILMDFKALISTCEEARSTLLSSKKTPDINKLGIYHGAQMYGYLNLKEFEKAKIFARDIDEYFNPGTLNWFIHMEYYYVLSIQTGNYENAQEILTKVMTTQGYENLKGIRQQTWLLMEGYMQFVVLSGIWEGLGRSGGTGQFRLAKFLNEVVSLSGDKTGIQVSVLILQILFMLQDGRLEDIIDRRDSLRRYVYRYLYSKDNERSRLFLSMLLRMIECDFSYAVTVSKTSRLLTLLNEQEMNYKANIGGNEIVDYVLLWDWILNHIKKNWSKSVA